MSIELGEETSRFRQAASPARGLDASHTKGIRTQLGIAALLLIFLYIGTSYISPMNGEDYSLAPSFTQLHHAPLQEVVRHSASQIRDWNARFGEQLAILWLGLPKIAYVFANTFSFLLLTWMMSCFARSSTRRDAGFWHAWSISVILTYLLWPRLEIFFWTTGSAGYLQPLVCVLAVLLPFLVPDSRAWLIRSNWGFIPMLAVALLAGASFENVGPGIIVAMLFAFALDRNMSRPERWRLLGLALAFCVGWFGLIEAPSTKARLAFYKSVMHVPPPSFRGEMSRLVNVLHVFATVNARLLLVGLICFCWYLRSGRKPVLRYASDLLLLTAGLTVSALVVLAPYTEARAFELFWVAALALTVRFIQGSTSSSVAVWIVILLAVARGGYAVGQYNQFAHAVNQRTAYIDSYRGAPECRNGLRISEIKTTTRMEILNNRDSWVMEDLDQVSKYFGCRLIAEETH